MAKKTYSAAEIVDLFRQAEMYLGRRQVKLGRESRNFPYPDLKNLFL